MKSFSLIAVLSAIIALAVAQITFNTTTDVFDCASAHGNYCGGDSLETNIIIRCADFVGQPGNCNDNLAGIPPLGVKTFAPCYQSSAMAGDAACSFGGIVYPDMGSTFPIPSNTTKTSSLFANISTFNTSSTRTSLATSSTANANAQAPYAFEYMTDIGGVRIDIAATETSLGPNPAVSIMTPHLFNTGVALYNPSSASYSSTKNGPSAPFPISKASPSNGLSPPKGTTILANMRFPIPPALAESLPSPSGVGSSYGASVSGGNSSNYSKAPSGTAVGSGRPFMTSPPFNNTADVTTTCVWTIVVGVIFLAVALL